MNLNPKRTKRRIEDTLKPISFLAKISVAVCVTACAALGAEPLKQGQPNVIVFLVDDIGYPDLACLGNPRSKTPNLDRLHKESVRFTDFHVTPMCTPTRSQLLTGRHCLDNEASMVTCGRTMPRTDLPMMSEVFKASGYGTGMFGKWHLGSNHPYLPMDRGFDEALYMPGSSLGTARDYWNNNGFDSTVRHNGVSKKYAGYITDVWNDEAMKWMAAQQKAGKPFFCYLPGNLVHGPEFVEDERQQVFRDKGYGETLSRIYAALERYDGIYGRVDTFLERSGLKENTIVIFFGDNGSSDVMTTVNDAGMRGYKKSLYDGGHRVQCFVRWPAGGWEGGRDFTSMTEVRDLFPTLMEACTLKPVENLKLDGNSLVKGLSGKPMPELDDRTLVVQYGHYQDKKPAKGEVNKGQVAGPKYGDAAVLWKQWRWVHGKELYDLQTDPGQKTNVADQHPEIAARLTAFYDQWWKQLGMDKRPLQAIPVGKDSTAVQLDIAEWDGVWVDFSNSVRQGERVNGIWHLEVMREGRYTFTLRRWPVELGLPMRAPAPQGPWPYAPGKALPIAKVRVEIQDQTALADVTEDANAAQITLTLKAGRTELKTAFLDQQDKTLSGSYYTDVQLENAK
ncbi:MAG: arylsulfatase [Luteolibacter sp.]